MSTNTRNDPEAGFSLVLGGPLYQLFQRAHLSGNALEMLSRRVVILTAVAWLPLLLLTLVAGTAFGDTVPVSFLEDVEAHVRFLVAVPLLVAAELIVHLRLLPVVRQFVERRIVGPEDMEKFRRISESTMRVRNSLLMELALLAYVYVFGLWVWKTRIALGPATWYGTPGGDGLGFTPAGYWFIFVSVPLFQFLLLRWYFRFVLWFSLLFRVSRLNLVLTPTHADRTGGLGFLGVSLSAFGPILVAQGAVLAGLIASQIFQAGRTLPEFKVQIVGFIAFFVVIVLLPLTVFAPRLAEARRRGLGEIGRLSTRYSRQFEGKWLRDEGAPDGDLLGSGDIQSLADLANGFSTVQEMRLFPFGWRDVTRLALLTAAPFLPLLLTIFSLEDVASYVIKAIF